MARLIDADAIEKEIYKWMPKDQETWMDGEIPPIENLIVSIMMTIQEQETIDAVPVIRCKDCTYYRGDHKYCVNDMFAIENGFCNWAERKEK